MSGNERRHTPRKICTIPVRFRTFASEYVPVMAKAVVDARPGLEMNSVRMATAEVENLEGETINLSERGISFQTEYKFKVGESVELFLTLPRELTGRRPEEIRCNGRIVHIEKAAKNQDLTIVGAIIDRFEPLSGRSPEN